MQGEVNPDDSHSTVRDPDRWVKVGITMQVMAVVILAAAVWKEVVQEGLSGFTFGLTVRLAWHDELHTRQGWLVLVAAALMYAGGSTLLARPYVRRRLDVYVLVPLAAVGTLAVFGVLALVIALIVATISDGTDISALAPWGRASDPDRKKKERK